MNIWKTFCRQIESKLVRRHFGDLVPLVDKCAIFEFGAEQFGKAQAYEPELQDDPVGPFPFPQLCLVGSGGVLLLRSPVMDEETGVLTYEAIAGHSDGRTFQTATCTVDASAGWPPKITTSSSRGIVGDRYFDEDNPYAKIEPSEVNGLVESHEELVNEARAALAMAVENGGDTVAAERYVEKVESWLEASRGLAEQIRVADEELLELGSKFGTLTLDVVSGAFESGLRQLAWINSPNHYTVEIGSTDPPRKSKGKARIRRLSERPRYVIMTKSEIGEAWRRVHSGTHASPMPHLRRGHYRMLSSDRFKSKRRVWVRPAHINGTCVEWRDGDVRYKVV